MFFQTILLHDVSPSGRDRYMLMVLLCTRASCKRSFALL